MDNVRLTVVTDGTVLGTRVIAIEKDGTERPVEGVTELQLSIKRAEAYPRAVLTLDCTGVFNKRREP